jgi:cell division protein FtsN
MVLHRHTPARRRRQRAFHAGSFAAGLVLGVVLTLTGAFLPALLDDEADTGGAATAKAETQVAPRFEFFDSLPKDRVEVDTAPYRSATPLSAPPGRPAEPVEYLLQAGSFTEGADADALRESLAALGLPAATVAAELGAGVRRHRVIVGPFADEADVRRAKSELRGRGIDALLLARKPASG